MKFKYSVILTSVMLGILLWSLDATLDRLFFAARDGGAVSLQPRLVLRIVVFLAFNGFGFVLARVVALREEAVARHEASQRQLDHLNLVLQAIRNVNQLILREKDPHALLRQACHALVETRGYTTAWIMAPRVEGPPLFASAGLGEYSALFEAMAREERFTHCFDAAQACDETVLHVQADPDCAGCPLLGRPYEDLALTTRLYHAGRSWGAISVSVPSHIGAGAEEHALLKEVAGDLAFALHDIELEAAKRRATSLLEESEQRYRDLFEHAPVGIFQTTEEGMLRTINTAAARIAGAGSPAEALQSSECFVRQVCMKPEDHVRLREDLQAQGQISDFEFEARRLDGEPMWVLMDARLSVPDAEGVRLVHGFAHDITARKEAEAALRESQRTLMTLMSNLPGMAYRCAADADWTMHFVSAGCRALTGYDPEELLHNVGLPYERLIHPGDQAYVRAGIKSAIAGDRAFTLQYRICTALGEEKTVWEQGRRISASEDGGPVLLEGLILDVTDRRRAEEAREQLLLQVRQQATQLEHVMDTVPEGVLLLDGGYRVMLANPAARRDLALLADIAEGEVLTHLGDRDLAGLLEPVDSRGWHEICSATRIYEAIAKPVEGSQRERWVMVLNDVTLERDRQKRGQRQEQLAAIGQLAAGIAHDFNNIIAVIVLYSQLAQRDPTVSPRLHEQLATIAEEAHRATHLIEQILDFGRRTSLERRPMDLIPFLKAEVQLLERTLPESIVLRLDYGRDHYCVNGDPTRLQQALMNLALNARDAMPEGGYLTISVARVPPDAPSSAAAQSPDGWVRLVITDTGTGIAPEVYCRLFEPFLTTKGRRGSGLGLAQVHGIVSQHDGTIDVQTGVGVGTTFTIHLPALAVRPSAAPVESDPMPRGFGEQILLVEDNPGVRAALTDVLTDLGYRVREAENGQQALEMLTHYLPDLVISDLVMPKMGGRALLQALRKAGLYMPFVMLSGHATESELAAMREEGLAGWLPKPPALAKLARLVAHALRS